VSSKLTIIAGQLSSISARTIPASFPTTLSADPGLVALRRFQIGGATPEPTAIAPLGIEFAGWLMHETLVASHFGPIRSADILGQVESGSVEVRWVEDPGRAGKTS
jgi:hypothetical protein